MRKEGVVEEREPVRRVSVAGDDGCGSRGLFDEDVTTLVTGHRLESEVIDDEQIDYALLHHECLTRIVETTLTQQAKQIVCAVEADVESRPARDVAESGRHESLSDADGTQEDDVAMRLYEAQARQFLEDSSVKDHLGGLVSALEHAVRIETRRLGSPRRRCALSPLDFVGEQSSQKVFDGQGLLLGEV